MLFESRAEQSRAEQSRAEQSRAEHIAIIDYIKGLMAIAVIMLHSGAVNLKFCHNLLTIQQAVPVFMLLSGFVYAVSYNKFDSFKELLCHNFKKKFLRLTLPVVAAFAVYVCYLRYLGQSPSVVQMWDIFRFGNFGSGAYYYDIMLQFLLFAPLSLMLLRRFGGSGILLIGLGQLLLENVAFNHHLQQEWYRIFIIRYMLITAFGIYWGMNRQLKISTTNLFWMMSIGMIYVMLPVHFDWKYRIPLGWSVTNMIAAPYVFAVVYIIVSHLQNWQLIGFTDKVLAELGKASYHILYVQMLWFVMMPTICKQIVNIRAYSWSTQLMIDIVFCSVAGWGFYKIESYFRGKLFKTVW